jgi:hypothetical protein
MKVLGVSIQEKRKNSDTLKALKKVRQEVRERKAEAAKEFEVSLAGNDRAKRSYYEGRMVTFGTIEAIIDSYIIESE